ncbi:MAG: histidine phosphatase family protein [Desulfovibrionaceae bacterium]|nr:histidine phosphatase family protein [Desulfovibrionaceae bacterium]
MNTQKRFSGWGDTHLTEKGVSAALKVGELLKKEGIPLTRSIPHASVELSKQLGRLLRAWI